MMTIAEQIRPIEVTLVPERREEITTEGGLDLVRGADALREAITRLKRAGVRASLFIDPTTESVRASQALGADAVELHTGQYAHAPHDPATLRALAESSALAASLGLAVHAGHGLSLENVAPVAAIPEIEELNIGHAIVGRAIFVGLAEAVREIRAAMDAARR
jgi:pyridoxine 5-phosphate synthase